ncbi:MAG: hypothetical protein R3D90_18015 [Paracoccaceae bacterium]
MPEALHLLSRAATLLAPHVDLRWDRPRRRGATLISRAHIGAFSEAILQSVDPDPDSADPAAGLSGWSRPLPGCRDPFPLRLWAFSPSTDAQAWEALRHAIRLNLLRQAQMHLLLTRAPLGQSLSGLVLHDPAAARLALEPLAQGRLPKGDLATLLTALYRRSPRTGRQTVNQA